MPRAYREPEYRRRIRQQAEYDQNRANDERDRSTKSANIHEIVLAIKAIDKKYDRETHKEHTRKKWDRFWEILGVVGLWLAAAVGISAIIYGTRDANEQRGIMQGQLAEMRTASSIQRNELKATMRLVPVQNATKNGFSVTMGWLNTGKTDAINFNGWNDFVFYNGPGPLSFSCLHPIHPNLANNNTTNMIPNDAVTYFTQDITGQQAWISMYKRGIAVNWGHVIYKDIFGTPHSVNHCHVFYFYFDGQHVSMGLPVIYGPPECNHRT